VIDHDRLAHSPNACEGGSHDESRSQLNCIHEERHSRARRVLIVEAVSQSNGIGAK
jgi:hypothetical protein